MGITSLILGIISLCIVPIWPVIYFVLCSVGTEAFRNNGFVLWLSTITGSSNGARSINNFLHMPFFYILICAGMVIGIVGVIFGILSKRENKMTGIYLNIIGAIVNFFFLFIVICS